ncbi:PilZ domain protein [Geotalea daltonii FRC-32]|uniref:PilZ domain protein n=1 Tax=Geotalea daltonii (strain DSM 22248 / JCM 15807 / FRC-32) TaxID=316067 RepID=B9M7W0_GEODF|nr:PilZ-like domain-containing protein [Geotalea daltonii]ACM18418.1 PilZ domain protein [Geotalea daltonii FRC-32]
MSEQNLYYRDYFHVNQRARVDLPLGNGRFFHEWAVISSAHGDLISLRLSRDVLPHDLLLAKGEPVSVRAGSGGQGYRCHAVIEDVELEKVTLRLSGSVIPDELRAYFRLDTLLEFNYSPAGKEETWELPGNRCIIGTGTGCAKPSSQQWNFQRSRLMEMCNDKGNGEKHAAQPIIVNISGGGLRAQTVEEIQVGSVFNLAFHLPNSQPHQVQTLAEVIYCQPLASVWHTSTSFSTGMRYLKINERSRDSIIKFVCSEEIKKIRNCNKNFHSMASN